MTWLRNPMAYRKMQTGFGNKTCLKNTYFLLLLLEMKEVGEKMSEIFFPDMPKYISFGIMYL